jgi:hypothetical protein
MAEKPEKKPAVKYVPVEKDGETLLVHPAQVEQHQLLGWKISGEPVEQKKGRK